MNLQLRFPILVIDSWCPLASSRHLRSKSRVIHKYPDPGGTPQLNLRCVWILRCCCRLFSTSSVFWYHMPQFFCFCFLLCARWNEVSSSSPVTPPSRRQLTQVAPKDSSSQFLDTSCKLILLGRLLCWQFSWIFSSSSGGLAQGSPRGQEWDWDNSWSMNSKAPPSKSKVEIWLELLYCVLLCVQVWIILYLFCIWCTRVLNTTAIIMMCSTKWLPWPGVCI